MKHPYVFLLVVLFGLPGVLPAQDSPSFKAAVDRNSILIGEPLRLGADLVFPAGSSVQLPSLDTVAHFEFIGKPTLDSLTEGTNMHYRMEWKLASFDSGVFAIPSLTVKLNNRDYHSDSLPVTVSFGKTDSSVQYHDIKGIIDIGNPAVRFIPWVLMGLTALGLAGLIAFGARHGAETVTVTQKSRSRVSRTPFDEAMTALDALQKMPLPDAEAVKTYYAGINDVFRVFVNQTQGFSSMEKTNEELIGQLNKVDMDKPAYARLGSVLRLCDFVKFAKYQPGPAEQPRTFEAIRDSIRYLNEIRK